MYCAVVPAPVTANVPELVTGLLATLNAAGIVKPTLVTVPVGIVGKVARLPSPRTYSDVVPLGVLNLPLNVVQSPELSAPLLLALAVGRLKVCVEVAELMPKSVPAVPVAKFCT
jgi:hypothetical protein